MHRHTHGGPIALSGLDHYVFGKDAENPTSKYNKTCNLLHDVASYDISRGNVAVVVKSA